MCLCVCVQPFYYLGLQEGFLDVLFANPDIVAQVGRDRTYDDPSTFWGSMLYERINSRVYGALGARSEGCCIMPHRTLAVSIGMDFAQAFKLRQRGYGVVGIRLDDLPPHLRSKQVSQAPLIIIPPVPDGKGGFVEPSCVDPYLLPLWHDLQRFAPKPKGKDGDVVRTHECSAPFTEHGVGVRVKPAVKDGNGFITFSEEVRVWLVLTGVHADTPMRNKLLHSMGVSALLGCPYCHMSMVWSGGSNRWLGYSRPAKAVVGEGKGKDFQLGVRESERVCTSAEVQHRQQEAVRVKASLKDNGISEPQAKRRFKEIGFKDECVVSSLLYYLETDEMFVFCFAHAFLRGPVRVLLCEIVLSQQALKAEYGDAGLGNKCIRPDCGLSRDACRIIASRYATMIVPHDHGRPPRNLVTTVKSWTIEELGRALDCTLSLALILVSQ